MGRRFTRFALPLALLAASALAGTAALAEGAGAQRIVTIGGAVTEIAFDLGQQDRVIARDSTSMFPPAAEALPDVGYMRALSPEGVLSVNPDLIVAIEGSGPPQALDVLREAEIPLVEVPEGYSTEAIAAKIRAVAAALDAADAGEALVGKVTAEIEAAEAHAKAAADGAPRRVLFILSAQGGRIMAGGTETAADAIITMSGAVNAAGGFEGYKPMTDEAIVGAAPDVILLMSHGGPMALTDDDLFALPAIAATPAGESRSVVRMNGLHLLGFGPRTASAITALAEALYGASRT